jgi:D-3-phosphoglycerate dehydrogenase / 2-oxoglutarate reductase
MPMTESQTRTGSRPRVVILDDWNQAYGASPQVARLRERAEVVIHTDAAPAMAATLERLAGAQIVVGNRERTRFDAKFFGALPDLALLAQTGDGVQHIDLAAATANGVLVSVTPGGSTAAMVELTIGMMIAVLRRFAEQDRAIRAGQWPLWIGQELDGKTLGVVGLGRLGSRVANVARSFGMRVLAAGPTLTLERAQAAGLEFRDLETLMAESDVVSIHVRLSDRTRGLITASHLAKMKPTAVLINTARGPVVDEGALIGALRSRRIAGAALDVYDREPLPANHPLLSCETALLTGHCGWVTDNTYERFISGIVENIEVFLDGQPRHVMNPEAAPHLGLTAYQRG